ncbi:biotin carboxylase N-terminal domain-containing protein [Diaminobutyricimonas sp. TR449]|uniref:ATP-binding protein n=1 Tax=Diaminobutyricimonas sp. TR449 TaxID=2708076 RepID=UPI001AB02C09|nr:biotin carboxylase N-terminal domain-containing protein [Diaminobutyricimonas sp. TR449]
MPTAAMSTAAMFSTVLVANRGEIACRVIRTLRRLGIRSVAVYSDADRDALHVRQADGAIRIGPAPAGHSYLDAAAIVDAAVSAGAQAVHPGYGFLSESAALAEACAAAGLVFVGPEVGALEVMGDKIRAKNHVVDHGVPVIPGLSEPGLDDAALTDAAASVGYPLLVKPSAGGGGKGMQVVHSADGLAAALAAARRIAASAFGDDTLLLERLVTNPRHIEVQVLADNHGRVIHLGERECSLQRRHQKVIEEAPSPLIDDATRARIGEAACTVASSVGYRGAGTVEFLVSADAPDEFFFMEMNTRLQVEHPVTEQVTGVDLVEWQLRIAAGEPLTLEPGRARGHAIEARIYAERPEQDFLPSAGRVLALREPTGEGIRVDSGIAAGTDVQTHYDPLLAKVIAHGTDRAEALTRLDAALAGTTVLGVHTNLEYLRALIANPDVQAGRLDTTLIDRLLPDMSFRTPDAAAFVAAALHLHGQIGTGDSPWQQSTGWRLGEPRPTEYPFEAAGREVLVRVLGEQQAAQVWVSGTPDETESSADAGAGAGEAAATRFSCGIHGNQIEIDGVTRSLLVAEDGDTVWVALDGATFELHRMSRREALYRALAARTDDASPRSPEVRTPMPGTVTAVLVTGGDRVAAGQHLASVEAMKMEHKLTAPVAGVLSITVAAGDLVTAGQLVATITNDNPEDGAGPQSQTRPAATGEKP